MMKKSCVFLKIFCVTALLIPGGTREGHAQASFTIPQAIQQSEWTPEQLPNVSLWLDASDENTVTVDREMRISEWRDKSPYKRHATQMNKERQPLWQRTARDNGSSLRFDGVDDALLLPSFAGGTLESRTDHPLAEQKKANADATFPVHRFGQSVSLNAAGDRMVIGMSTDEGFPTEGNQKNRGYGAVYLYSKEQGGWKLEGVIGKGYDKSANAKNISLPNLASFDNFGQSVALNAKGDRLVVGAPLDDGESIADEGFGAVYVFSFADDSFSDGELISTIGKGYKGKRNLSLDLDAYDRFGVSVSWNAAGDRLAVGADFDDGFDNKTASAGAVYLLHVPIEADEPPIYVGKIGKGYTGIQDIEVTLDAYDNFGASLALDEKGTLLFVGAPNDDGNANQTDATGAVYAIDFMTANFTNGRIDHMIGSGYTKIRDVSMVLDDQDHFGAAIAVGAEARQLVVGATDDDGKANANASAGALYLFEAGGVMNKRWNQVGIIGEGYDGANTYTIKGARGARIGQSFSLDARAERLVLGIFDGRVDASRSFTSAVYTMDFLPNKITAQNNEDIIRTSTPLTTADRQKLEGYLAYKQNKVAQLPDNHPFRNAPPLSLATTSAAAVTTMHNALMQTLGVIQEELSKQSLTPSQRTTALDTAQTLLQYALQMTMEIEVNAGQTLLLKTIQAAHQLFEKTKTQLWHTQSILRRIGVASEYLVNAHNTIAITANTTGQGAEAEITREHVLTMESKAQQAVKTRQMLQEAFQKADIKDEIALRTVFNVIPSIEKPVRYDITLTPALFEAIKQFRSSEIEIATELASFVFTPAQLLTMFSRVTEEDAVILSIEKGKLSAYAKKGLSPLQQQWIGKLTTVYTLSAKRKSVLQPLPEPIVVPNEAFTLRFPYALLDGDRADRLTVMQLMEDGTLQNRGGIYRTLLGHISVRITQFDRLFITQLHPAFSDVNPSYWAHEYITSMAAKAYIKGQNNGKFEPTGFVSRAELAKMIALIANLPPAKQTPTFKDINPTAWYAPYVASVVEAKYIGGYPDGRFKPEVAVTREELVAILVRLLGKQWVGGIDFATLFSDSNKIAPYAKGAIEIGLRSQMIQGSRQRLRPKDRVTRAEATKMLYRLFLT